MTDEPFNAADRAQVKARTKRVRLADNLRIETLRLIMSHSNGRAFVLDLLERGHIFEVGFSPKALNMAFMAGERNYAIRMFADVAAHCPDDYVKMMQERAARDAPKPVETTDAETDPVGTGAEESGGGWGDDPSAGSGDPAG